MAKSKKKESEAVVGVQGLYEAFLLTLSSSERESIEEKGVAHAMPAFRKFLNTLSEVEMAQMVGPVVASEDEE